MRKGSIVIPVLIGFFSIVAFLGVMYFSLTSTTAQRDEDANRSTLTNLVGCTDDAMACPDGSFVGRTSPNCEFAACPDAISNPNTTVTNSAANTNTNTAQDLTVWLYGPNDGVIQDGTPVSVYSDNGVRCVTTPCETNGRTWTGALENGKIVIPANDVDESMTITVDGYQAAELHLRGTLQSNGTWLLQLVPKTST